MPTAKIGFYEWCHACGDYPIIGNCWVDLERSCPDDDWHIFCTKCVRQKKLGRQRLQKVDIAGGAIDQDGKYIKQIAVPMECLN